MPALRNNEIDHLRAIAVVVTVMAHSRLLYLWNPEWLTRIHQLAVFGNGVDVFFVISGFVITRSLRGRFAEVTCFAEDYRHFIVRRFWRLAPAALFFCGFYMFYAFVSRSGEVGSFLLNVKNTVAVITLTANLRDQSNLMAVYWTLASEWQFYLIFPFFLYFSNKKPLLAVVGSIGTLVLLFLFGGGLRLVELRFDCMLYGVLLALLFEGDAYKSLEPTILANRSIAFAISLLSVFLLVFIPVALIDIPRSVLMGVVSINCAFLVWIASYEKRYLFGGYFRGLLRYIGVRSYSIYLCHGPALYLTHDFWYWYYDRAPKNIGGDFTLRYTILFLVLVWAISEMSYRFLERPFTSSLNGSVRGFVPAR